MSRLRGAEREEATRAEDQCLRGSQLGDHGVWEGGMQWLFGVPSTSPPAAKPCPAPTSVFSVPYQNVMMQSTPCISIASALSVLAGVVQLATMWPGWRRLRLCPRVALARAQALVKWWRGKDDDRSPFCGWVLCGAQLSAWFACLLLSECTTPTSRRVFWIMLAPRVSWISVTAPRFILLSHTIRHPASAPHLPAAASRSG